MKTIEQKKRRWTLFADPKSEVSRLITIECSENMPARPPLLWEYSDHRVEWSYERYLRQCETAEWLDDDTIPQLSLITGTEIFAEAFGCRVHYPDDNNPFALPMVHSAAEASKIRIPELESTRLALLFDMADKLRDKAGRDALLALPDIQSPMDIAALIWEKTDFFMALFDEPEAVRELAFKIRTFMFGFFDRWFERYGSETWAHYPDYYIPRGITMSEDEIGSVSADVFGEFFADELNAFSERYGGIGIHCCANSKHQWKGLSGIRGLKLINICQPPEIALESLEVFRDVCGQLPGAWGLEVKTPGVHFAKNISVKTPGEALRELEAFEEKGY